MYFKLFILVLFVGGVIGADLNRCGNIPDNRTVYTKYFDSSNGHTVLEIKITTNTTSGYTWKDIVNDTSKWDTYEPWVYCNVSIGGATPINCEAERRGDWSMESPLPSLKVKLLNKKLYKGMDRLLLSKHPWDTTRVRNKLSYELLQRVPELPSLFTQFATVTVNNQYYGIYTLVEDVDLYMLKKHGLNDKSNLYKANYVFWSVNSDKEVKEINDPEYHKDDFEIVWDIRGKNNHSLLISAYKDIYDPNVESRDAILKHFNVHNVAAWLAFSYLTANTDLVFNNFGLYAPPGSNSCPWPTPFYFYTWDHDGAWDDHYFDDSVPGFDFPYHEEGFQYFWPLRIVKRFLQVDEFVDILKDKLTKLVSGPLSQSSISPLVSQFKIILEPYLKKSPDKENLVWDATIKEWKEAMDILPFIPTEQYNRYYQTTLRPMPIDMTMKYTQDKSSMFFYWEKSYILYNKPFYYEFSIASNRQFESKQIIISVRASNTFVSIPTNMFAPSTTYHWRVIVRNTQSPHTHFIDSYPALSEDFGFGIMNFTTPSTIPSLSPSSSSIPITRQREVSNSNGNFHYATLDNVDPSSSYSQCSNNPLSLPSGWNFAPNSKLTRNNIKSIGLPWGGSKLVLADGTRISPRSGLLIDGFGDFTQHLVESTHLANTKAYSSNCSSTENNRILLVLN